ncbi:MAG: bifunctional hydroxymethylpyrimidine kinase/phosphomethylpyrimidine kinase [Desulforhopalus sp.]
MMNYCRALTIAGSDSGGGAGIQADLKTFSALGCYGMSAITAITAQNTVAVTDIHPVPPECIASQIDAVLSDIGADTVKIGMLHSSEVISCVADRLSRYQCSNIVLDPVMVAKSGDHLLQADAVNTLKSSLLPMAAVVTPNLPEASVLLGWEVTERNQMADACRELGALGCRSVFLKGGHLSGGTCIDIYFDGQTGTLLELESERFDTVNSHGTGCTVSSAIAAFLGRGLVLPEAVQRAKKYVSQALNAGAGMAIGHGHGPVHHFHAWWSP